LLADHKDPLYSENGYFNQRMKITSRKKRGLKILSVKVFEIVYIKQKTTYKEVALELIKQMRLNNEMKDIILTCSSGKKEEEEEEEEAEEEASDGDSQEDHSSEEQPIKAKLKWEKNVKRRVYDALNVLYASGILIKQGKNIWCDTKLLAIL